MMGVLAWLEGGVRWKIRGFLPVVIGVAIYAAANRDMP
jgi:hypothetical protein